MIDETPCPDEGSIAVRQGASHSDGPVTAQRNFAWVENCERHDASLSSVSLGAMEDGKNSAADKADHNRAQQSRPEPIDVETKVEASCDEADQQQHQGIDDQQEESQGNHHQAAGERGDNGFHEGIDQTDQHGDNDQGEGLVGHIVSGQGDTWNEPGSQSSGKGGGNDSDDDSHASIVCDDPKPLWAREPRFHPDGPNPRAAIRPLYLRTIVKLMTKALIVRGGWEGHAPVEATDRFVPFLEAHGYEVRIEDSPQIYADAEVMAQTDLIVQCNTMNTIEEDALKGLREGIAVGTGFAGWHGGIADSYRNSSDYLQLVGAQFTCHPPREGADGELTNYVKYRVDITSDHEIVAGIESFELTTEEYWVLSDDYNDVLATTTHAVHEGDPWHRPVTCPAVWTRNWGQGRIFVATPGHSLDILDDPNVRTIIERGMLWASRKP